MAVLGWSLFLAAAPVSAEEDTAPATAGAEEEKKRSFSTGVGFFDEADLGGGLYYFQRDRRRYDKQKGRFATNLNHATIQANADFSSGFVGGLAGIDLGVFGSADLHNSGAVDHEMNFLPWSNPWHPDWNKTETRDGVSVYKAYLKIKTDPVWAKAGYFQPSGPGVIGVNWSIMPGTYQGVNAGADIGGFSVALAWADAYKAPWFTDMNRFRKNDGTTNVPWLWSSGIRYAFPSGMLAGLSLETAYGASRRHLQNAHFKSRYELATKAGGGNPVTLGYHLYAMRDSDDSGGVNDNFAGTATQHYAFVHYAPGLWLLKLEGTYTRAPMNNENNVGYFAYRLTDRNGSSKGAYDVWWDARSDWNAHDEKAVYAAAERTLDDLLPVAGFSVGIGAAIGWDGQAFVTSERLKEWAVNFDVGYTKPDGPLKGAFVKIHYTEYRNGSRQPSWVTYKNAFQDEHDIKIFAGIPFSL